MPYKPDAPASACTNATNTPGNTHSAAVKLNALAGGWDALAGASGLYWEET